MVWERWAEDECGRSSEGGMWGGPKRGCPRLGSGRGWRDVLVGSGMGGGEPVTAGTRVLGGRERRLWGLERPAGRGIGWAKGGRTWGGAGEWK